VYISTKKAHVGSAAISFFRWHCFHQTPAGRGDRMKTLCVEGSALSFKGRPFLFILFARLGYENKNSNPAVVSAPVGLDPRFARHFIPATPALRVLTRQIALQDSLDAPSRNVGQPPLGRVLTTAQTHKTPSPGGGGSFRLAWPRTSCLNDPFFSRWGGRKKGIFAREALENITEFFCVGAKHSWQIGICHDS
jgi:hypothetical protein